jgi:hypothetical protein
MKGHSEFTKEEVENHIEELCCWAQHKGMDPPQLCALLTLISGIMKETLGMTFVSKKQYEETNRTN